MASLFAPSRRGCVKAQEHPELVRGLCVTPHHPQQGYCQFKRFVADSHLNIEGTFYQEFTRGLFQQIRAEEGETREEAWLRYEVWEMLVGYRRDGSVRLWSQTEEIQLELVLSAKEWAKSHEKAFRENPKGKNSL